MQVTPDFQLAVPLSFRSRQSSPPPGFYRDCFARVVQILATKVQFRERRALPTTTKVLQSAYAVLNSSHLTLIAIQAFLLLFVGTHFLAPIEQQSQLRFPIRPIVHLFELLQALFPFPPINCLVVKHLSLAVQLFM